MDAVYELRRYTLHPGRRDELIELFDREFVESQEDLGASVAGTFRDLDDPDRFVWLRGFRDMAVRLRALTDFYGGPVWKANSAAANATMVDSDDVLLLRPVRPGSGPSRDGERPPVGAPAPGSVVVATVHHLAQPVGAEFRDAFEAARPVLTATGAEPLAYLETEYAVNDFPGLPVRTGEHVFVWFAADTAPERYSDGPEWTKLAALTARTERMRLSPTGRSLLR
ncbi:NIPSNAP family protein [Phytomonospora endophytica]|uniref:Quinol monooxygenase YgiN n=1 Tax=Phytomonospora endophytica TaxID=714109 RepID=A0A841FZR8_9ACTN|nr:NIPSNAP family protein [Phytomonospora endophytica]MBB6038887.1 quinol monooxygenase YgiN [Phytomonospora endophytica]GIG68318.1 NIPSNAP family containing protein [Phytomonospora endophytica]